MYDFITIGGTTRDISFFTSEGVLIDNRKDVLRQRVLAFESGAKIKVDKFFYSYGGGAANAAVCLSNFGLKTACLAPVGNDENGRLIIKNLKMRGVDAGLIQVVKGEESGSSFILVSPGGERIIFAQRGANRSLRITSSTLAALKKTKNIYIASLSGEWEKNLRQIFSVVKQNGPRIFWNPGMTQYLDGVDKIAHFLKKTTVLASNKDEAIELIKNSQGYKHLSAKFLNKTENLLKIMYGFGPQLVVITMGAQGVMAYNGHKIYNYPIIKEKIKKDTTGVGDIFNSSLAAGLAMYDDDIDRAIRLGLRNAAAKVAHIGAQNNLITK